MFDIFVKNYSDDKAILTLTISESTVRDLLEEDQRPESLQDLKIYDLKQMIGKQSKLIDDVQYLKIVTGCLHRPKLN